MEKLSLRKKEIGRNIHISSQARKGTIHYPSHLYRMGAKPHWESPRKIGDWEYAREGGDLEKRRKKPLGT